MTGSLKNNICVVLHIQIYFIYLIFHHVQEFVRKQLRKRFCKEEERKSGEIRVSRIIFKYKWDPEEISRRQDFITACGHYVTLETLDNPNWHLYCIEKERVFFVLLPRCISHYSTKNYPFMYVPIYEEAVAIAEVPKEEFFKLARMFVAEEKVPNTVLFTNTARSGSTLLAKMLDRPGDSVCFGEPHALVSLSGGLEEGIFSNEAECKEMLEAAISCLRAHVPNDQVCVLKTTSGEARLVPLCEDITKLKHIFLFRKKGLPSVEKVVRREEFIMSIFLNMYHICPQLTRFITNVNPVMEGAFTRKLKPENLRMYSAIVYASPYSHYCKNKHFYCHPVVWYHELIEDTSKTLISLFNAIDIPVVNCIEAAVACKQNDSQKDSFLSKDKLAHIYIPPVTEEDKRALEKYAKEMEISRDTFEC